MPEFFNHPVATSVAPVDYFSRRGCLELALSLLQSAVAALGQDPKLEGPEARFEFAWLTGRVKDSLLPVETVLATLQLDAWGPKFAQLAIDDPKALRSRLDGLGPILTEMAESYADSIAERDSQAQMEATLDSYRERARAC